MLEFQSENVHCLIFDLVHKIAREESKEERTRLLTEFKKLHRFQYLLTTAAFDGWAEWDWKEAKRLGYLSPADLKMFEKEVEG